MRKVLYQNELFRFCNDRRRSETALFAQAASKTKLLCNLLWD